jgi:hypothetical protein
VPELVYYYRDDGYRRTRATVEAEKHEKPEKERQKTYRRLRKGAPFG